MRKKQKIDLILHSILERKKNLLDKMTELSEADNSPVLENIQKEIEKSQVFFLIITFRAISIIISSFISRS
jgi:hypothetical protein